MKSAATIWTEGMLYVIIAAGSPIAEFLTSDRAATNRNIAAIGVVALVAGANALKAFFSQSMQDGKQGPTEVVAPKGEPLKVIETKPKTK